MRGIDDSMASKSMLAEELKMTNLWNNRINKTFKNEKTGIDFLPDEITQAISINRGNKEILKTATTEVKKLADNIKSFTEDFQKFAKEAGYISPQKIEDYFPRVLDYAKIDASKESRKATEKIIADIYRSLGVSGKIKNKKSPHYGKDKADVYAVNYLEGHKNNFDSVLNNEVWNSMVTGTTYKGAARGEGAKSFFAENDIRAGISGPNDALWNTIKKGEINPKDINGKRNQLQILSFLWNASKAQTDIYLVTRLLSLEKSANKIKSLIGLTKIIYFFFEKLI